MQYEKKGTGSTILCHLEKGEKLMAEKGVVLFRSSQFEERIVKGSLKEKLYRVWTCGSLFQKEYTAKEAGDLALSSEEFSSVVPIDLRENGLILKKDTCLAWGEGVRLSAHFIKKVKIGCFGGFGFALQKLTGEGTAFLAVNGESMIYSLKEDEKLVVRASSVIGFDSTVKLGLQKVRGWKNKFFGGESLYYTVLKGKGNVYLQTLKSNVGNVPDSKDE